MQAEFSRLIKEENFINTGLVCRFNGGDAGMIRRSKGETNRNDVPRRSPPASLIVNTGC